MNRNLSLQLVDIVHSRPTHDRMIAELFRLRDAGLSRQDAQSTLEKMRSSDIEEEFHDFILEVLDRVTGYCNPAVDIWGVR